MYIMESYLLYDQFCNFGNCKTFTQSFLWVASNIKVFQTSKKCLYYFKILIKKAPNLESLEKLLKTINRRAKIEQLATKENSITVSSATSTILVCHYNSQYFVTAPANIVYKAEELPCSIMLPMRLHYVANI